MLRLSTFSIAARCARTGMFGVAVSTAVPGVGSLCPFAKAGVGAVATQSWVNPYLGIDGLRLLAQGQSAKAALERLVSEDPGRDVRQVGLVDRKGDSAAWSGPECVPWFGHLTGPNFSAQGNMLVREETVRAMAEAFRRTEGMDLPERLVVALEAGQAVGGDKRGKQSAALLVVHKEEYPYCELRVDEHPHPVAELRRVFEVARHQLLPFVQGLPSRWKPLGGIRRAVQDLLGANVIPVCVGGDHSLSLPILRAVAAQHGPVGMVHIDSHQDMWEEYFGNKYFHGTPFRRAIEEKLLDTRRVVQIGIRGPVYAETDFDFGRKHGVRTITAEQVGH